MGGKKGDRYERLLVNAFEAAGYATMRAGSSGSATEHDRPDVIAGRARGSEMWAAEVKMTSKTVAYADPEEAEALDRWARAFGATPVIAARYSGERVFWLVPLENCRRTDSGTLAVSKADREASAAHSIPEVDS